MVEMAKQRGHFAGMLLFAVVTHLLVHWVKEDGFVFPKKFFMSMELGSKSHFATVKSCMLTDFQHMCHKEMSSIINLWFTLKRPSKN